MDLDQGKHTGAGKVQHLQSAITPMDVVSLNQEVNHTDVTIPEDLVDFLKMLQKERKEKQVENRNREEWQSVASVLDRLFLLLYGVGIFITTAAMIGGITTNDSDGFRDDYDYLVR